MGKIKIFIIYTVCISKINRMIFRANNGELRSKAPYYIGRLEDYRKHPVIDT